MVTWHRTHVCFTINLLTHVRTHPERARGGGDTPSRGFPRMAGAHLRATKPAGTPRPVAHLLLTQPRQSRVPNTPSSPLTWSPLTYKVAGISIMSGVCGVGLAQRCSAPWSGAQGCSSTGYPPARLGGLLGLLSFPSQCVPVCQCQCHWQWGQPGTKGESHCQWHCHCQQQLQVQVSQLPNNVCCKL